MTQSVRTTGLKNHLGEERYSKFVELINLGASNIVISRAIKADRKRVAYFRAIYHEELTKNSN